MLSGLDWSTPLRKTHLGIHGRQFLCIALGAAAAAPLWLLSFPAGYWFIKLWAALTTGSTLGMIFGTIWQLRDPGRRAQTSGQFIALGIGGWGFLSAISLFLLAPMMRAQEEQRTLMRSLDPAQILEVWISPDGQAQRRLQDRERIAAFAALAKAAESFHPDHEGTEKRFRLTFVRRGLPPLDYEGRVPTRHLDDIVLQYRSGFALSELLIPGGRKWLEDVTR